MNRGGAFRPFCLDKERKRLTKMANREHKFALNISVTRIGTDKRLTEEGLDQLQELIREEFESDDVWDDDNGFSVVVTDIRPE